MSRRDPLETASTVAVWVTLAVVGLLLFRTLVAHPAAAALWAALATCGMGWLGALYADRLHAERLRALAETERRRAVAPPTGRRTVAEMLAEHRSGSRIGDAERDVVVGALHAHYAAGRLTVAELEDRLAAALSARTIEDLAVAVRGLPSEVTGR